MAGVWTPERVDSIRTMALAGLSATQIAVQLGEGITRNMICGVAFRNKFHFLGVGGYSSHKPRPRKPKSEPISKPKRTYLKCIEITPEPPPPPVHVTLMELESWMCKWPIGDPRREDFRYCGAKRHEEYPYCSNCCMLAYESPESRNADAQKQAGQNRFVHPSLRVW